MLGRLLFDQLSLGGLGNCATPGSTPCCGCDFTFCVVCAATPNAPLPGATVTVKSGATVIGSCGPTNSSGCCTVTGIAAGTYTILVTNAAGETIANPSKTIACNSITTIAPDCCAKVCFSCPSGSGANPLAGCSGVTVTIKSGATTVWTGGIDATGCCYPVIKNTGGTYSVTLTGLPVGFANPSGTFSLSCLPSTNTVPLTLASGYVQCCGGTGNQVVAMKTTLTLTDANGSRSFLNTGTSTWGCCYNISITTCNCDLTKTTNQLAILYTGICTVDVGTGNTIFTVTRTWAATKFCGPAMYEQSLASGVGSCVGTGYCGAGFDGGGGPGIGDTAGGNFAFPSGCSPFAISGALTPTGTNFMPDPVGGTVAIS